MAGSDWFVQVFLSRSTAFRIRYLAGRKSVIADSPRACRVLSTRLIEAKLQTQAGASMVLVAEARGVE